MFEAVVALCLDLAGGPCRDHLLTGYEAETLAACETALVENPPSTQALLTGNQLVERSTPHCQPIGPVLPFAEIAPGTFVHMGKVSEPNFENLGDVSNIGFIIGQNSVAVIDTGSARWMGEAIWRSVRAHTDKPISHVILTHMHPDHVLGAAPLAESGAQVVGHASLERALADRQANYRESLNRLIGPGAFLGTGVAPVDLPVENNRQIDLGGRILDLRAWPTAHTGSDLTVLDTSSGTLFTGDLVFHRHTPALDGRLMGWRSVLEDLIALKVTQVVPGHGGPVLQWPEGAEDMRRYLNVLEDDTRASIDAGLRLGDAVEHIASEEAERWELFEAYNPRNATVAFTELEWE